VETNFAVNTLKVSAGNLDDYLEFGGDVVASSSVDIVPDTSGKLAVLHVAVGDTVRRNQLVAEVDPSRPGMTYSLSPVRAPIAGTITSLPVAIGSMTAPSLSIGKVSNTNDLEIALSVAERFVSRIRMNQRADIRFDAYPEEIFKAKVTKISPVLDTTTRTMAVTLKLDPPDSRIRAGMFARIKLITEQRENVIVIPWSAFVTRLGENYVFLAKTVPGTSSPAEARRQQVSVGLRVDNRVEIISGISPGDIVVVKGQSLLEDGSKLNIISQEEK
jgi:RND family efflux transporter MFP subunit